MLRWPALQVVKGSVTVAIGVEPLGGSVSVVSIQILKGQNLGRMVAELADGAAHDDHDSGEHGDGHGDDHGGGHDDHDMAVMLLNARRCVWQATRLYGHGTFEQLAAFAAMIVIVSLLLPPFHLLPH